MAKRCGRFDALIAYISKFFKKQIVITHVILCVLLLSFVVLTIPLVLSIYNPYWLIVELAASACFLMLLWCYLFKVLK